MQPAEDLNPPVIHLPGYQVPIPMPGSINTAGGEDSPFILPDGSRMFFFFTPDVRIPAEKQLLDGVTGIWWSQHTENGWLEPQRVLLNADLALDGCPFFQYDILWFCSARAGGYRNIDWYTARLVDGTWSDWQLASRQVNLDYQFGELHISADGSTLIFHRTGEDGYGDMDLWQSQKTIDGWSLPVNLGSLINTAQYEGWPFLSPDGSQLWFTRPSALGYPGPAIWLSSLENGHWTEPQEVISSFAGECTLDTAGNIYFVHHFFSAAGEMLEADIYVAYHD